MMKTNIVQAHRYQDLIELFNATFLHTYNTLLVKGDDEPVYLPQGDQQPYHQILFAHGFYSSALHEIAHWCVASQERRKLVDFGYWYKPDGRNAEEQRIFEIVEVKPQALEWIFSVAVGFRFRVSADNVGSGLGPSDAFKKRIHQQAVDYVSHGLPPCAALFVEQLITFYGREKALTPAAFSLDDLQ